MAVQPLEIKIDDEVLTDLRQRLAATRWPDEIPGSGWDYGMNLDYLKELVDYWLHSFDWQAQEKLLNSFHHFRSEVDGLNIHFIHERGQGPNPMPLVITHGWPSTFFEMSKIIPLLADPGSHGGDPADSFDVVAPSLPGFGFSDRPKQRGMQVLVVADMWAKLMTENLGYRFRYAPGPLRFFVEASASTPTLEQYGIGRYIAELEEARNAEPGVMLLPGVEVPPYYYWTGSLLTGDLTLNDMQRNVLVLPASMKVPLASTT